MIKVLEQAIEKVKALPSDRQAYAAHVLEEIAAETGDVYPLTDEERKLVREGLAELDRGEYASDSDVEKVLRRPWA
jgi:hypothetical protein